MPPSSTDEALLKELEGVRGELEALKQTLGEPPTGLEVRLADIDQRIINLGVRVGRMDQYIQAMSQDLSAVEEQLGFDVRGCSKCGRRVRAITGKCGYCGTQN